MLARLLRAGLGHWAWPGLGLGTSSQAVQLCKLMVVACPPSCPLQALLDNHVVLELLAPLKHLYWWVESTTALTSWHLAYLVTWITCLASHLLQAAFEHTAQLAQAKEAELQEALGPSSESLLLESSAPEAGPVPPEHETPGE